MTSLTGSNPQGKAFVFTFSMKFREGLKPVSNPNFEIFRAKLVDFDQRGLELFTNCFQIFCRRFSGLQSFYNRDLNECFIVLILVSLLQEDKPALFMAMIKDKNDFQSPFSYL